MEAGATALFSVLLKEGTDKAWCTSQKAEKDILWLVDNSYRLRHLLFWGRALR